MLIDNVDGRELLRRPLKETQARTRSKSRMRRVGGGESDARYRRIALIGIVEQLHGVEFQRARRETGPPLETPVETGSALESLFRWADKVLGG